MKLSNLLSSIASRATQRIADLQERLTTLAQARNARKTAGKDVNEDTLQEVKLNDNLPKETETIQKPAVQEEPAKAAKEAEAVQTPEVQKEEKPAEAVQKPEVIQKPAAQEEPVKETKEAEVVQIPDIDPTVVGKSVYFKPGVGIVEVDDEVPTPSYNAPVQRGQYDQNTYNNISKELYSAFATSAPDMKKISNIILDPDNKYNLDNEDTKNVLKTFKSDYGVSLFRKLKYTGTTGSECMAKILNGLSETFDTTGMKNDPGVKKGLDALYNCSTIDMSASASRQAARTLMELNSNQLAYIIKQKGALNVLNSIDGCSYDGSTYGAFLEHLNEQLTKDSTAAYTPKPTVPPTEAPTDPPQPSSGYKYISKIETDNKGQIIYTLINGVKVTLDSDSAFNEDENVQILDNGETVFNRIKGALIEGTEKDDAISVYDSEGVELEGRAGNDQYAIIRSQSIDIKDAEGNEQYDIQGSVHVNILDDKGNDKYNVQKYQARAAQGKSGLSAPVYSQDITIVDKTGDDNYNMGYTESIDVTDIEGNDKYKADHVSDMELNDLYGKDKFDVSNAENFKVKAGKDDDEINIEQSTTFRVEGDSGEDTINIQNSQNFDVDGGRGTDKIIIDSNKLMG